VSRREGLELHRHAGVSEPLESVEPVEPEEGDGVESTSLVGRLLRFAQRLGTRRPSIHPAAGISIALVLFIGSTVIAFRNLPPLDHGVRWWPLVLIGILAWIGAIAIAGEFWVSSAILGHRVPFGHALRVAVISTAANMLPIPGAVIVKTRELNKLGSTYGSAIKSTGTVGLGFVGTSLMLAGVVQLIAGPRRVFGAGMASGGLVFLVAAFYAIRAMSGRHHTPRLWLAMVGVESASVLLKAAAVGLAIYGVGFTVTLSQMTTLAIAYVIALAIGIFPAGLGITELIVAVLSPTVGLDAAVGLLSTSVRRVVELVAFSGLAIVVAVREMRKNRKSASVAGPE
jgi:hypothetical protein